MNFALFVEGHTERAIPAFLKRWLDPRLSQPVGIKPVRFKGSGDYLKNWRAPRFPTKLVHGREAQMGQGRIGAPR